MTMRTREKSKAQLLEEYNELRANYKVTKERLNAMVIKHNSLADKARTAFDPDYVKKLVRENDKLRKLVEQQDQSHRELTTEVHNLRQSLEGERKGRKEDLANYGAQRRDVETMLRREVRRAEDHAQHLREALMAQALAAGTLAKTMGVRVRVSTCSTSDY